MIRPTRRAVALASVAPALALLLVALWPSLWAVSLGYLALLLLAMLLDALEALPARRLGISIRPIQTLYIGEADSLDIELTAAWRRPPAAIELRLDHDPILDLPAAASAVLGPTAAVRIALPLHARRRGQARLAALWLRWQGPLGLVQRQLRWPIEETIRVLPNIRAVRAAALRLALVEAPSGAKALYRPGDGSEFDALRDYMPGLDRRTIDWKHSARHRRLVSKEFRAERNHQIILAFDTGYLMREPLAGMPRLDHAINAGLLIGYTSLKAGDRVGLFGFDAKVRRYAEPQGGTQQFRRLQYLAAELDYAAVETNFTLALSDLAGRLNRRSLVVLMTEFVDTVTAELMVENVARLSKRHLVLFVTLQDPELKATIDAPPASFTRLARSVVADEMRRDRLIVFERLRRLGVQCLEAAHQRLGPELVDRYLAIKRREVI